MNEWVQIVLAFVGGGALTAIIEIIRNTVDKKSAKNVALQFLLLQYIREEAQKHIDESKISSEDLRMWLEMHKTYKRLGGNGYADELKNKITRLPLSA
jgi:uncharacterized protein YjaZ